MKKSILFVLVALLLVCAVACSSSPSSKKENKTGIEIELTADQKTELAKATTFTLMYYFEPLKEAKPKELPLEDVDVSTGKIFIELEPGNYEACLYCESGQGPRSYKVEAPTKGALVFGKFTVNPGEVTLCKLKKASYD